MKPYLKSLSIIGLLLSFQFLKAQNCAVNAGLDQTICVTQSLTLTGLAGTPKAVPNYYQWSKISGPDAVITTPSSEVTTVTGFSTGNYVFKFVSRCSDNILAQDYVAVTVLPTPPSSLAGADVTQCSNTPVSLNANPVSAPLTGTWTVSPAGGSFSPNANAYNAIYTPPAGSNTYTLTWTISNGYCSVSDNLILKVVTPAAISAGPDITRNCNGTTATMAASSPGVSPPQTGIWSVISGPNVPVFSNINLRTAVVSNLIPGTYTLRWSVSGPCSSGFDDMVINVINNIAAPSAGSATTYTTFCNSSGVVSQVLNANPLTAGETAVWTQTGGGIGAPYPNVSFTPNTTSSSVTVSGLSGTFPYTFSYTKTNASGCTASATHTVYRAPTFQNLTNPPDQELACNAIATTVQFSYDDLPTITTGITRVGTFITGPSTGTIAYSTSAASAGTRTDNWNIAALTSIGTYIFRVEYRNACGSVFRDIAITTSKTPGDINAGSDIVLPCNTLTAIPIGNVSIPGTYNWTQVSGPNTATIVGGSTNTPTMSSLIQGVYKMRLQISGGVGCAPKTDDMLVTVTQNAPTIASTGANATVCAGSYQLAGNQPNSWEVGTWTASPSIGISFSPNANSHSAVATGLADTTTYTFTWTVSNSCGSVNSSQTIVTNTKQSPAPPNAGADICLPFGSTSTSITATNPGAATLIWTALTTGSTVTSPNVSSTTVNFTGGTGIYLFECRLSVAGCNDLADTVAVSINHNITANAGTDITICAASLPQSLLLNGTSTAVGAISNWSQLSGPAGAIIETPNNSSTNINNMTSGLYVFQYDVTAGNCAASTDFINIRISAEPSTADAGPDQSKCAVLAATAVTLAAVAPTIGTGYWQIISSPQGAGTATITNSTSPTATVSNLTQGTYTLRWTVTNGPVCADKTDDMIISVSTQANAGVDVSYCNIASINLTGNANTTGTWSFVSGPAGSTITTNSPNTAVVTDLVTSIPSSNYIFRYSLPIYGACPATTDDIGVKVYPTPSQASGGADVEVCYNQSLATLTGNSPTSGTASWAWVSGPTPNPTAGIANTNKSDTNLNVTKAGLYTYNYSINTTTPCVASTDPVLIIKEDSARAGVDQQFCNVSSINLSANSPILYQGTWSLISGPAGYTITNVNNPTTTVTGLVAGVYLFRWTIGGAAGCTENYDEVQITIDPLVTSLGAGNKFTFCEGSAGPIQLGASAQAGITYAWSPNLLLSDSAIAQPLFTGLNNAGTYYYTLRANAGSCEAFSRDTVIVNSKPAPLIAINSLGCNAVTFTGSNLNPAVSSPTYTWNFGAGALPATATGAGPHSVVYIGTGNKTATLTIASPTLCSEIASITITGSCFPLPITISQFSAARKQDHIALAWKAQSGINFSHFEIERSLDGLHFISIGKIFYKEILHDYSFDDDFIPNNVSKLFYRLKLIDIDKHFSYSQVAVINIITNNNVLVWPNPVTNQLNIEVDIKQPRETVLVELFDALGSLQLRKIVELTNGKKLIQLNHLEKMPSGYYNVRLQSNTISMSIKLVK